MPVYNGEKYLAQAVESILAQTESDFEFVIVDDGSTDTSVDILKKFKEKDTRVKLFLREHRGLISSLNYGVSVATSLYIARMDSDDIALPARLEKQYEFMQNNDVSLCGTWAEGINSSNGKIRDMHYPPEKHHDIKMYMIRHNPFIHSSVMFTKDIFDSAGGYKSFFKRVEDYELWTRMIKRGKVGNIQEALLQYRFHDSQVTKKHHTRMLAMGLLVRVLALLRS